jgi:hypothetical protein
LSHSQADNITVIAYLILERTFKKAYVSLWEFP